MKADNQILLIDKDELDVELALFAPRELNRVNGVHVLRDGAQALEYLFGAGREVRRATGQAQVDFVGSEASQGGGIVVV